MGVIESSKKLGFGTMRMPKLPEGQGDPAFDHVDLETTKRMVDLFLERGFTYFDAAWMYHNYRCEEVVKEVLTDRHPREAYTLAAKMHNSYFKGEDDLDRVFAEELARCGVTYFDYYLIHDIGKDNEGKFESGHVFEWAIRKKAEGLIRHVGFSCHDEPEFLDQLLTRHPEVEFVQIQLNYLDWESEGIRARECLETINRHGKSVIVMEPVKGGTLVNVPDSVAKRFHEQDPELSVASWAIRFAASQPGVEMVLSGMSSPEQVLDNTGFMADFRPLDEAEYAIIREVTDLINEEIAIPCTACSYCTEGCPMNIPIPKYFSLYNTDLKDVQTGWTPQMEYYERLAIRSGSAGDCIGCGQCEEMCPQHLPVIQLLREVAERFE